MELKPSVGNNKAFVYTAHGDFADQEIKSECLAIRFGSVEFANQFKEKFEEGRKYVSENCKLYNDDNNSDKESSEYNESNESGNESDDKAADVTRKLSELDVSKKEAD